MNKNKIKSNQQPAIDCKSVDIIIARNMIVESAVQLKKQLAYLEQITAGVMAPNNIGQACLRVVSGESLKAHFGKRQGRRFVLERAHLEAASLAIKQHDQQAMRKVKLHNPLAPFFFDPTNDQLSVRLVNENRAMVSDRFCALSSLQKYMGIKNLATSELNELTGYQAEPTIAVATVRRQMIEPAERAGFALDPNQYIRQKITNHAPYYLGPQQALLPEDISFGGLGIICQRKQRGRLELWENESYLNTQINFTEELIKITNEDDELETAPYPDQW